MSASLQSKYVYPFTALLTVNFKHYMFTKKVILPFMILGVPLIVLFIWRIFIIYADLPPGSPIGDPYLRYSQVASFLYLQFLVPLIALSQGTALLSEEWQAGTMILQQIRPVPRWVISAGKLSAYLCCTGILLTFSLSASFALAASAPDSGMVPADLPYLFRDLRLLVFGLAAYGSVMMAIGIYFRRTMVIGILFLGWDLLGSFLPGYAHQLTIRHYLHSLFPGSTIGNNAFEQFITHSPASNTEAVLVLFGIIVAGIFISAFIFSRKTVQPASQ